MQMDTYKEAQMLEHFERFEKSLTMLDNYMHARLDDPIEQAGFIHFFEVTYEHALKVIFSHLDSKGIPVDTVRAAMKQSGELPFLNDVRAWLKMDNRKKLAYYVFTDKVRLGLVKDIKDVYQPEMNHLHSQVKSHYFSS
ncbi:nucleotidyltransferase substrate binding protein [Thalassobacillus hwangdonensis]|uniref:Nucleotidyltransferase substrate binding protein n=1 Tax=Thalassobacillus hwangdonensis TaxID=546108 RepID=A0ABW3KXV2_9BACI